MEILYRVNIEHSAHFPRRGGVMVLLNRFSLTEGAGGGEGSAVEHRIAGSRDKARGRTAQLAAEQR